MLLLASSSMCLPFLIGLGVQRRGSRMLRLCRVHSVGAFEPDLFSWMMGLVRNGAVAGGLL